MKKFIRIIFFTIILFCLDFAVYAGPRPFFRNFTPTEYGSKSQNWAVAQDKRGYVYIGNNACLLRFNGKGWDKIYPFGEANEANDAIVRSLFYDVDSDRLYIGSFHEFGYLEYDSLGTPNYKSLSDDTCIMPDDNDEIWYIAKIRSQVFFIYFTSYYIYDTNTGTVAKKEGSTSFFYNLGPYLYLLSSYGELRKYDGCSTVYDIVPAPDVPSNILKVFPNDSSDIVVSTESGLFKRLDGGYFRIDTLGNSWGVANRAIQCTDGTIVVGFISGGVAAFDGFGKELWHLSMDDGLIDNTVLALCEDSSGNIWSAFDKGIAVIFSGGDQMLSLEEYNLGKITTSLYTGSQLLVGSNRGLNCFGIDRLTQEFTRRGEFFSNSQIWSIYRDGNQVFVGENSKTYLLSDVGGTQIVSNAPGGCVPKILTLSDGTKVLIQGSFTMLYIYKKNDTGDWVFSHTVNGFMRPVKNLEVDYLGNIWLEHMYKGIYCITLSEDGKSIAREQEFFIAGAKVCKMGGRVLLYNRNGFMYYDENALEIRPFDVLNEALGEFVTCDKVIHVGGDRYWLKRENSAILILIRNDKVKILDRVNFGNFGVSLAEQFETIIPLEGDTFLFGVEDGFLVHKTNKEDIKDSLTVSVSSIIINKHIHEDINSDRVVLPNNAMLEISLHLKDDKYFNTRLKCELSGYEYEPISLDNSMSVTYPRLPHGSYVFNVWRENEVGSLVPVFSVPVIVKPSFFASMPALLIYIICFIGLFFFAADAMRRILERQRIRLEAEKKNEIITLRNEQLENSLLLKSKELATYSLIESRRNQVLTNLRQELNRIKNTHKNGLSVAEYDSLMHIIREGEFNEDNWDHFYNNFDLIHQSFFKNLNRICPNLTTNDLRTCAYLRLNMSTKELADVMGITLKGAEAAKYRLRKKLGVDSSIPLSKFLSEIGN